MAEYLVKGFTLDDERLKNPPVAGSAVPDRFDELLERICDIRASERRIYLRVREIFSMAADYSPALPETTRFFRFIQNKLHFAVTGKTAAELIAERADSRSPNMGLTTWRSGSVQKADATVAKNYLRESEIGELNVSCLCNDAFSAWFSALLAKGLARVPRPGNTQSLLLASGLSSLNSVCAWVDR